MHSDGEGTPSDARVLDGLARRYAKPLNAFFRRRAAHQADTEDLVQETFLRLAVRTDLSSIEGMESYLFQVARSVLRDRARRSAARISARALEEDCFLVDDDEPSPERVLLDREAIELLAQALIELPERPRTVFVLQRFEQLPYKEIARRLGVSLSTVDKDMMKALAYVERRARAPA